MGDGHDYDVWYNGMVIANVKAFTDKEAVKLAKKVWGNNVTVSRS